MRATGGSGADLELWVDGTHVATESSPRRTDMRGFWNDWTNFVVPGWTWGAEKQAAAGTISQYEDFKGLLDELRFWSGLAHAQAGDLDAGVAEVRRAAEANPNWLVLLQRLSPEFAPAAEAVRQQMT